MTASTTSVNLEFDDLTIAAHSSAPGHVGWLREFLEPDFSVGMSGRADCTVQIDEDEGRYLELLGAGPPSDARLLDCFALDSSVVRLPIVKRDNLETTVLDAQFDAVYVIEPEARRVTIVTSPGNLRVRASLLRVVREFAMNHLHGRGLLLHASAVCAGDTGIVIAGHKAAGKTTMLTYLLGEGFGDYVSNDRVVVTENAGHPLLRNIPTVISIRPGTLEHCPSFRSRFLRSGFSSYLLTMDEALHQRDERVVPNQFGNYFLSPAQFRSLVDARQQPRCPAGVLIFPLISNELRTFEFRELSAQEAVDRLPEAFLGAGGWRKGTDAFAIPSERPAPDEADLLARAARLGSSVRRFECRLGPLAFEDGSLASELARLSD